MALWSSLTGGVVGVGVGEALGTAIDPALEPQRQKAWMQKTPRVFDVDVLADMVAMGLIVQDDAEKEAHRTGFSSDRLDRAVQWRLNAASVAETLTLWRRAAYDQVSADHLETLMDHALAKAAIEPQYWEAIKRTKHLLLSPAELAMAVQQGHLPNETGPGGVHILPSIEPGIPFPSGYVQPPSPDGAAPSTVPLTQIDLPVIDQAAGAGTGFDQLRVLANLAGLPPGPHDLLAMWNRNEIDEDAVDAGIREGHMKTKWAHSFKRMRWAVLTAPEYAELRLRDWITDRQMNQGGALTGHTPEQMDLLYKNRGRPATPRQVWLGWAREIVAPDYPDDPANGRLTGLKDHEIAIRRSNIRPEYAKLLWDVRFNYPSLFQLNRLVEADAIDADTAASWAHKNLEAPEVVDALRTYWQGLGGSKTDPLVKKADTQLWGELHRSYLVGDTDDAAATPILRSLGASTASITTILSRWATERSLKVKKLTAAQVKKAFNEEAVNAATGQPWTHADALAYLIEELHYNATDAASFLAI